MEDTIETDVNDLDPHPAGAPAVAPKTHASEENTHADPVDGQATAAPQPASITFTVPTVISITSEIMQTERELTALSAKLGALTTQFQSLIRQAQEQAQ